MAVTVKEITKFYGKQKALDQVSFTLKQGEICGFLGPNGAGKSTMMKIITGFLGEYSGEVNVYGIDVRKQPLKAKALIGYLPEHNPLYPEMYIKEYLMHIARLYNTGKIKERVEEIIELTRLVPERRKKIGQLSKGYRQRVGLAQALIHDPEVLILDEPMTGLDPNQLEEIRNLITHIGKNKTVLLSTHIMQEVEAICDRIIIINNGQIVADGYKQDLYNADNNGLRLDVRFANKNAGNWLSQLEDINKVTQISPTQYHLFATIGKDPRIALFYAAATNNCPIIELKVEEKNLEEVFKELTKIS